MPKSFSLLSLNVDMEMPLQISDRVSSTSFIFGSISVQNFSIIRSLSSKTSLYLYAPMLYLPSGRLEFSIHIPFSSRFHISPERTYSIFISNLVPSEPLANITLLYFLEFEFGSLSFQRIVLLLVADRKSVV